MFQILIACLLSDLPDVASAKVAVECDAPMLTIIHVRHVCGSVVQF